MQPESAYVCESTEIFATYTTCTIFSNPLNKSGVPLAREPYYDTLDGLVPIVSTSTARGVVYSTTTIIATTPQTLSRACAASTQAKKQKEILVGIKYRVDGGQCQRNTCPRLITATDHAPEQPSATAVAKPVRTAPERPTGATVRDHRTAQAPFDGNKGSTPPHPVRPLQVVAACALVETPERAHTGG